jgi:hypothetical protein
VTVVAGAVCGHHYVPGTPGLRLTSASVVGQPSHGTLASSGGLKFRYQPTAGFKGADRYVIRVCGTSPKGSGCSTLNYRVTLQ